MRAMPPPLLGRGAGVRHKPFELDKYKTKDKNEKLVKSSSCALRDIAGRPQSGLARGHAVGESINFTRDLANEPPNILTPTEMATGPQQWQRMQAKIEDSMRLNGELGMGSLLSRIQKVRPARNIDRDPLQPPEQPGQNGELIALSAKALRSTAGAYYLSSPVRKDSMKTKLRPFVGQRFWNQCARRYAQTPNVPVLGVVAPSRTCRMEKLRVPSDV